MVDRQHPAADQQEQVAHGTPAYAEQAYINETLHFLLSGQDSPLNTPVKKKKGEHLGMTEEILSTAVSQVRQSIESLFNWIEEKTGIQTTSKVRSTPGETGCRNATPNSH